tara:strand:- start:886 stop:1017 length:132 start_codon:yes stop_codon:yes gene_type:complete
MGHYSELRKNNIDISNLRHEFNLHAENLKVLSEKIYKFISEHF